MDIFLCQILSTNAPYTYIHLSLMVYGRSNWKNINISLKIQGTKYLGKEFLNNTETFCQIQSKLYQVNYPFPLLSKNVFPKRP